MDILCDLCGLKIGESSVKVGEKSGYICYKHSQVDIDAYMEASKPVTDIEKRIIALENKTQ